VASLRAGATTARFPCPHVGSRGWSPGLWRGHRQPRKRPRKGSGGWIHSIQETLGGGPLNAHVTASPSIGKVGRPRTRHVCRTARTRSTPRSPIALSVPCLSLRQRTAHRRALSARWLVGSTPASTTNVHRAPNARASVRASVPASSFRARPWLSRCPSRRWRLRPGHQALPCCQPSAAKAGPLRLCPFRQPPRPPEQLGQTRLPAMEPWLVHRLPIADHQLCPGGDQRLEGGVAPARLHREPRHGGVDQHPPPGHPPC
jgi:hypothetical protein